MVCINLVHKGLQATCCKLSEPSVSQNFSSILFSSVTSRIMQLDQNTSIFLFILKKYLI